jgi:hypothetical protein
MTRRRLTLWALLVERAIPPVLVLDAEEELTGEEGRSVCRAASRTESRVRPVLRPTNRLHAASEAERLRGYPA